MTGTDHRPGQTPDQFASTSSVRIGSLDLIRGVAVLGILAANIVAFGQPFTAYMWPDAFTTGRSALDDTLWVAQFVLVDGKMRALFTLLFGAGMMLFMERAWARGSSRWLQVRRLFWLLLFGLIHYFLIWKGDILTYYALTGLLALLFVKLKAKTQLMLGICSFVIGALIYAGMMVPLHFIADTPFGESAAMADVREGLDAGKAEALADDDIELSLISTGDYSGYVAHNLSDHTFDPFVNLALFILETFPLMLIGMALYKKGFFESEKDAPAKRKWGWTGLLVGGLLSLLIALWAMATGFTYYGTLAAFVGLSPLPRLMMALGLAALLVVSTPSATGWLGQRLSAAGRAAFSNYLGTSLVMIAVFHGWGLGLFGELARAQLYLVMLGAWVLMLLWSKPWLDRFRFGPLEWLWRCLTYGKIVALGR